MSSLLRSVLVAALLVFTPQVFAATTSPVGTWQQVDDATGKPKSIIQITDHNGKLQGKVLKVLLSDQGTNPICKDCEGERHNKPVVGMTIMWDMSANGDHWSGGKILDPHNGKVYKCKVSLGENGDTLDVRGYIGLSMFGRTQTWHRIEQTNDPANDSANDQTNDQASDQTDDQGDGPANDQATDQTDDQANDQDDDQTDAQL